MKSSSIVLASRPAGAPDQSHFRIEEIDIREPQEGEVSLRVLYLSLDPYMRGRMSAAAIVMEGGQYRGESAEKASSKFILIRLGAPTRSAALDTLV